MSKAIHEAISSWLFQDIYLKKNCGDFGVLGTTRLLDFFARVLRDGKQIRVQLPITHCHINPTVLWSSYFTDQEDV